MFYQHQSCTGRSLNRRLYYCEPLHLGSNVHDCKETVGEDGNVLLEKEIILFAEAASRSAHCLAEFCEVYQGSRREQDSAGRDVSQGSVAQKSSPLR